MLDPITMLDGLAAPTAPSVGHGDAETAREFEAMVIQIMVKEMRNALPDDGLFASSSLSTYNDMFDAEIAKRIADNGGFGLADSLQSRLGSTDEATVRPTVVAPVAGRITSRFGPRHDPFHGGRADHRGIDLAAPEGTHIRAAKSGVVSFAGRNGGYGNLVVVDHGDGTETRYAHCATVAAKVGEAVEAGQPIATVGQTGRATGPHLHFEMRRHGTPIDPLPSLRDEKISNPLLDDPTKPAQEAASNEALPSGRGWP